MNRQLTYLGCRLLASQLVLKMAEPADPTAARKPDMSWLESYTKPFGDAWQKARGIKADKVKDIEAVPGDFAGAAQDLWKQRPGTLLGLGGMLAGAGLGSASDSPGASLRWAAILGALGLGAGAVWGKRDDIGQGLAKWLQPHVKTALQPTLDDAKDQLDKYIADLPSNPAVHTALANAMKHPATRTTLMNGAANSVGSRIKEYLPTFPRFGR